MDDLKKFTEAFFTNLKCKLVWQDNILVVDNVPKNFEDFYGKKAPYHLVFGDACPVKEEIEVITKGSFLLKTMSHFLENRGQTTLLKIDLKPLDMHSRFRLKNCKIIKLSCREDYKFFPRFTFQTTFQYLNEKEQLMNQIYVDKAVFDFNPQDYQIIDGKKQDIQANDVKEQYNIAKEKLKQLVQPKIQQIGTQLDSKLANEITRIKALYKNQFAEVDQEIKKIQNQLLDLEAGNTNGDLKNIPSRINKLKEHLEELEKKKRLEESGSGPLVKEEQFFINDEIHKHALNIDNKLVNTTLFYFPIFNYSIFLKSQDSGRQIELTHNPLSKEISLIKCESCQRELSEISLCSSGHITCQQCEQKCRECGQDFCLLCLDKSCSYCSKKVCKKCAFRCGKCGKTFCKSHTRKTSDGRISCSFCSKICAACGQSVDSVQKCPSCNKEFCLPCSRKNILSANGKTFCTSCSQKCPTCQKLFSRQLLVKCVGCKAEICNHIQKCPSCRKQLCIKLRR